MYNKFVLAHYELIVVNLTSKHNFMLVGMTENCRYVIILLKTVWEKFKNYFTNFLSAKNGYKSTIYFIINIKK